MKFIIDCQNGLSARGLMEAFLQASCDDNLVEMHQKIFKQIDWEKAERFGLEVSDPRDPETGDHQTLTISQIYRNLIEGDRYNMDDRNYLISFWNKMAEVYLSFHDLAFDPQIIPTINSIVLGTKSVMSLFDHLEFYYRHLRIDHSRLEEKYFTVLPEYLYLEYHQDITPPTLMGMLLLLFLEAKHEDRKLSLKNLSVVTSPKCKTYGSVMIISGYGKDECAGSTVEIRFNVDDMTGESIGYLMNRLLEKGALDAYFTQITMKKGRPGILITLTCKENDLELMTTFIFSNTSTNGLKIYEPKRFNLVTSNILVETEYGRIRAKLAEGFGVKRRKFEFDDLILLAESNGIPLSSLQDNLGILENNKE